MHLIPYTVGFHNLHEDDWENSARYFRGEIRYGNWRDQKENGCFLILACPPNIKADYYYHYIGKSKRLSIDRDWQSLLFLHFVSDSTLENQTFRETFRKLYGVFQWSMCQHRLVILHNGYWYCGEWGHQILCGLRYCRKFVR